MMLKLYNTLTRQVEPLTPQNPPEVKMYMCGPTVYDYAHIGHMRKYVGDDVLVRTLRYLGYEPKVVMNITDVGHLVSDEDEGEDKMEKGARKHGLDVWQLAKKFEQQFFESIAQMNIDSPAVVCRATDHIQAQIDLVKKLEVKGFTYRTDDGIYFDTSKFPEYGQLAHGNLEALKEGARVEKNPQKRNPTDFALWKFSPKDQKRQMEWSSPWGAGFPGWHIECSAMSMEYLGDQLDIHTGGVDHITVHHPNEVAQSEAVTGKKPFVRHWVHHNFLMVEGKKMSKSLGNMYTVADLVEKGFQPLALRYLFLTSHYRSEMNFTFDNLAGAQKALERLYAKFAQFAGQVGGQGQLSAEAQAYEERFQSLISEDLKMPEVLALVWELVKSSLAGKEKYKLLRDWDGVLGLGLLEERLYQEKETTVPEEVEELLHKREQLRLAGEYEAADRIRDEIKSHGFEVEDRPHGARLNQILNKN